MQTKLSFPLAIRTLRGSRSEAWRFDPALPHIAEQVRSAVRRALELHARADALERLDVIFAELVSNAIRHAPGILEMRLEALGMGGDVVLHVIDRGPGYRAKPHLPNDLMSENGRGLFIIAAHADGFVVKRRLGGGSHARILLKCAEKPRGSENG